jgi:RNA polymerase sigma-70 factor (ECF subfamily)
VLAQDFVDRYRNRKRLVSLEEREEEGEQFASPHPEIGVAADPILDQVIDQVLAELPAEDRYVLAAYYLDGRTLADIARMLKVHESTMSRKVAKLTRQLRDDVIRGLMARGRNRRAAEEALDIDVRDLSVDVKARLQPAPDRVGSGRQPPQGTAQTTFHIKDEKT